LAAVRKAVDESTPWASPSAWSNPDFDKECSKVVKEAWKMRWRYTKTHSLTNWQQYKVIRNQKKRIVAKALRQDHQRRVQQATEDGPRGLWQLAKWARGREGAYEQGMTPPLKNGDHVAETVEDKAALFQSAFFPTPPLADLTDITNIEYSKPLPFPTIEKHEIETVVKAAPADKALGEDTILNSLWHKAIQVPEVIDRIHYIFNACIAAGYSPARVGIKTIENRGPTGLWPFSTRWASFLSLLWLAGSAIWSRHMAYCPQHTWVAAGVSPQTMQSRPCWIGSTERGE
jgi:hypothetical protein